MNKISANFLKIYLRKWNVKLCIRILFHGGDQSHLEVMVRWLDKLWSLAYVQSPGETAFHYVRQCTDHYTLHYELSV